MSGLLAGCGAGSGGDTGSPQLPTALATPSTAGAVSPSSAATGSAGATGAAASGPVVYAAMGASETYGVGATPVTAGYAYLVRDALHPADFVDTGIPGTTLSQGYQTELSAVLSVHPTVCTVFFGVNDVRGGVPLDAFLSDLHSLLDTLHRAGITTVVIGMPNLSTIPAVAMLHLANPDAVSAAWNSGMASAASAVGADFLPLTAFSAELAAHPEYIAGDGLHPSTAGHARLAQIVVAELRRLGVSAAS